MMRFRSLKRSRRKRSFFSGPVTNPLFNPISIRIKYSLIVLWEWNDKQLERGQDRPCLCFHYYIFFKLLLIFVMTKALLKGIHDFLKGFIIRPPALNFASHGLILPPPHKYY